MARELSYEDLARQLKEVKRRLTERDQQVNRLEKAVKYWRLKYYEAAGLPPSGIGERRSMMAEPPPEHPDSPPPQGDDYDSNPSPG